MEFVREITAFLENKPGRLAKICSAMAHEKLDIKAICVMEMDGRSVLRMVTEDVELARKVLTSLGTESATCELLSVEMENKPGALAKVLERLAEEHINVEYAYMAASAAPGRSTGLLHTSNPKRAQQILAESAAKGTNHAPERRPLHSR